MADEIMDAGQDNTDTGMSTSGQSPAADQQSQPPVQSPAGQNPQQPTIQVVAAHPKAHLFHSILETLGGGDKTQYSVDPQTGAMSATRVPQTSGQLGKTILAGALTGLFAGAGEHGPGSEGRSAAAGFQAASQQRQQQQAQAQNQAKEDFERQQQQKVRQAQIVKANMEAMRSAYALGKENDETKDKVISNHADDLKQWKDLGQIKDSSVPSSEMMQRGFDPSKYVAIPDGRIPVTKPDGSPAMDSSGVPISQLTYSVVDATGQAPLTQQKYDQFVKYGLQKPNGTGGGKIPDGATVSSAVLAQMNHKIDLIDQTQAEVDKVSGPGKINLIDEIRKDPQALTALEQFHNDAVSGEPFNQIDNMAAKHPTLVGKMRQLMGGEEALQAYKDKTLGRTKAEATKQEAEVREQVKAASPEGQLSAQKGQLDLEKTRLEINKLKKDTGVDLSRIQTAPTTEGLHFDTTDPNYPVNQSYVDQVNQVDPGMGATIKAIGEGREILTPQAARTKDGQALLGVVNRAYPRYNAARVEDYLKTRQSPKIKDQLNILSTAMEHLGTYYDNLGPISGTPIIGGIARAVGSESAKNVQMAENAASDEFSKLYKGGAATEKEKEEWQQSLGGATHLERQNGARGAAKLLDGKIRAFVTELRNSTPPGLKDDSLQIVSPEASAAYKRITGKDISSVSQPMTKGPFPVQQSQQQQNVAPEGTVVNVNGQQQIKQNGKWVPYSGK